MDPTKPDLAVVSMHEKGFPQGDLYLGFAGIDAMEFERLGAAPDAFFTMKKGDTLEQAAEKALQLWPTAIVVPAADDEDEED
jgi:hypothetical protein